MEKKDFTKLSFSELIETGKTDSSLADIIRKFEEDSACESIQDNKESILDIEAKLPYDTENQTIFAHALLSMWWQYPEKTKWSRLQISREHTRVVAKLVGNNWGHAMVDSLDDTLPQVLAKDYAPVKGDEIVKPIKIVVVTNSKKREVLQEVEIGKFSKAPIADSSFYEGKEDIGSIRVILNENDFNSSTTIEDFNPADNDQEYKKFLDSDSVSSDTEDVIYLRINAMHEGIWNFTEITREELEKAASTYVGRLVIEGHKWDDPERALGEVLKATVKFDPEKQRYYLEVIAEITKDRGIKEVRAGRYKFVSIGATMKAVCNICGMTANEGCKHLRGIEYDTYDHGRVLCIKTALEIVFEELSFINVPAARWARVLDEIDPTQVRELLAASKNGMTVGIEIETENTRILPTLDEYLSFQEDSIVKLYNSNQEESFMADQVKTETQPESVDFEANKGNISPVEAPKNPLDGGTVDSGAGDGKASDAPAPQKSDSEGNISDVPATENPLDGGTVDTGAGDSRSDVKGPASNQGVRSDEVTEDAPVSLNNEMLDEMDVTEIYDFAKQNGMVGVIEALVAANAEGECTSASISVNTKEEAIIVHALLHRWEEDLTATNWKMEQIKAEHDRIVAVLEGFGVGHVIDEEPAVEVSADSAKVEETKTEDVKTEETKIEESAIEVSTDSAKVEETKTEDVATVDSDNISNPDLVIVTLKLEESQAEVKSLTEKVAQLSSDIEKVTSEFSSEKEKISKELFETKLALAKSMRENKKFREDLEVANRLIASKIAEVEKLNSEIQKYVKVEQDSVVNEIISIKKDSNKYSNEEAIETDRKKFSSMSMDVLKTLLGELTDIKANALKTKAADELGVDNVVEQKSEVTEVVGAAVSGDDELKTYQKQEGEIVTEDKTKVIKKEKEKKSIFALAKQSLFNK